MTMRTDEKLRSRTRRHRRVRKKIVGTPERPRLAVFRSNKHIYAQVIDDVAGRTVASSSTLVVKKGEDPLAKAKAVGLELASTAKQAGVSAVSFDRGGFMYHGRVKALADGAREGGLEF